MHKKFYILVITVVMGANAIAMGPPLPALAKRGLLPLPVQFQNKQIYYISTPCIPFFSCGYYTLENALILEQARGLKKSITDEQMRLRSICFKNIKPGTAIAEGMFISFLKDVGLQLNLQPVINLKSVKQDGDKYKVQVSKKALRAMNMPPFTFFKQEFESERLNILHFLPTFDIWDPKEQRMVRHVILISVVREYDGTISLYIFDNCNFDPTEQIVMSWYIAALYNTFVAPDRDRVLLQMLSDLSQQLQSLRSTLK
jgi:hypothetical protein